MKKKKERKENPGLDPQIMESWVGTVVQAQLPALRTRRQENQKLKAILSYVASSKLAWATGDYLKINKPNQIGY